jgi:hypothetical protein
MQWKPIVRLYADEDGESRFEDMHIMLEPVDFAPPAPPLNVAALFAASHCSLVGATTDWGGDIPHPSPRRQLFVTLSGSCEVTASDGTVRSFPVGSMLLLEDTTGKGHSTRILDDAIFIAVALED